ncbi:MAG: FAD-dependent oxidoreductase [Planctomycetota bacterium]
MLQPLRHTNFPDTPLLRRRAFLRTSAALYLGTLVGCASRPARETPRALGPWQGGTLPAPDLSDDAVLRFDAGIRPFRRGTVRLDVSEPGQLTPGQRWVHNYGHGGSGWTMSWGCAEWSAQQLQGRVADRVAVLGGGVIGLTSAMMLARRGVAVTVYADRFEQRTTSARAGAQFAPSLVRYDNALGPTMDTILRTTHRAYLRDETNDAAGVHRKTNFTAERGGGALRGIPDDLSRPRQLDQLPFAELPGVSGWAYDTLHIEPPKYLAMLQGQLAQRGVRFESRRFETLADVAALPERHLVNCLGLGAGTLLDDRAVIPIRGQLVHLRPQPALTYMFSHRGYMFPRSDVVVIGGTIERGQTKASPQEADCAKILAKHRAFWGRGLAAAATGPNILQRSRIR